MKRWLLSGLFAVALLPVTAYAQTQQVQCAIGYVGGAEHVVLTFGAYNVQTLIDDSASACTDLIATGNWIGVDKQANWKDRGYQLLCQVWFGPTMSADVYSQPLVADRLIGYQTCGEGGNSVVYTDVGPAADVP